MFISPSGTRRTAREILHRPDGVWAPWITFAREDARVSYPNHLDTQAKTLFVLDSRGRDTVALTPVDLGTCETTLIAAHNKANIGAVLNDQETRTPIAYSVITERLEYFALDARIRSDLDFLAGQNIGDWFLSSRMEDDRLWVIGSNSDTRPFVEYLFDREAKSLRELHHVYPELAGAPLVPMRPVTITSRDGLDLVSYVTLPKHSTDKVPQPMVLVVHGGPWARDTFGFNTVHRQPWLCCVERELPEFDRIRQSLRQCRRSGFPCVFPFPCGYGYYGRGYYGRGFGGRGHYGRGFGGHGGGGHVARRS